MIRFEIPGFETLEIQHLLLDYNGTIAVDGIMPREVANLISKLAESVDVTVLTADTYGTVRQQCEGLGVQVLTFPKAGAAEFKLEYARELDGQVACLGNGRNDIGMFDEADLAIAVIDGEGACAMLISHADIVVRSTSDGLSLLLNPDRVRATLRS